ncbi:MULTISPECIES: hypothetical protein [Rhodobacterales]|uniref:hypothetical protein n=1 Tax=Rhodobacterales TaxID=204455 RepID=UPI0015F0FB04|nr:MULTISPECIES: hypothetical protein [Rhodobacterales]
MSIERRYDENNYFLNQHVKKEVLGFFCLALAVPPEETHAQNLERLRIYFDYTVK